MKVAELTGAKLDYWVGKANDIADLNIINGRCFHGNYSKEWVKLYSPSTDWACGGPIIEREKLVLMPWVQTNREEWASRRKDGWPKQGDPYFGATPLIAAMRCFVASKFGEEAHNE